MLSYALEVYNQPPAFLNKHIHPKITLYHISSFPHTILPSIDIILNIEHNKPQLLFLQKTKFHT